MPMRKDFARNYLGLLGKSFGELLFDPRRGGANRFFATPGIPEHAHRHERAVVGKERVEIFEPADPASATTVAAQRAESDRLYDLIRTANRRG